MRKETVSYTEIPKGHCFTFEGAVLVYFEDTERGETKRTFHSYKDGQLYKTTATIANKKQQFYTCDVYGQYIPCSLVKELKELRQKVKELEKPQFKCTLSTGVVK